MSKRPRIYSLAIHVHASDDTPSGHVAWDAYLDEKCSPNADIRDHRRELLEAVIETAQAELAELDAPPEPAENR